jgi:hypothetical protein
MPERSTDRRDGEHTHRDVSAALKTIKRVFNTTYDTSLAVGLEVEGHAHEKPRGAPTIFACPDSRC